jgi:hypothetical protein
MSGMYPTLDKYKQVSAFNLMNVSDALIFDEFETVDTVTTTGRWAITTVNAAGAVTTDTTEDLVGAVSMTTGVAGAAGNDAIRIALNFGVKPSVFPYVVYWRAKLKTVTAVVHNIGLTDNSFTKADNKLSVYFTATNGGNFYAHVSDGNADQANVDSGVAAAANTVYDFMIIFLSKKYVLFVINGNVVATYTPTSDITNINAVVPTFYIKTTAAAAKTCVVDTFALVRGRA